ncbi:hypothetical protein [Ornithinimicrobium avium]|uniref:hypothetical protein n=1 Tax=Ornithinimicrobium avium TaxID=2283195 RepID=UPI0013B3F8F1|nr:hypothetical protein [Ornithinimicrobium avium]
MTGRRRTAHLALPLALALTLGGCGTVVDWPARVPEATVPPEAVGSAPQVPAAVDEGLRTDGPAPTTEGSTGKEPTEEPVVSKVSGLVPLGREDLADLAAELDRALTSGDEEEWIAFFDGDEDLLEQQRRWFRGVQAVPMDVREILPETVVSSDTPEGTVVQLVLAHQISGADPVPAVETYRVTVQRPPGGEPRITRMAGQDRQDGHPQLWDLQALAVTVTDDLVVLAPQGRESDVAAVLPGLESATANVFLDFDEGPRDRLVVQLADADDLRAITDDQELAVDPAGVAMTSAGLAERPERGEVGVTYSRDEHVDRIVLDLDLLPGDLTFGTPPGGFGLMRHEGVHAVVDGAPGVRPPVWVWEGLAQWYGFRRDYVLDDAYRAVVTGSSGQPLELPDSFDDYYYDSPEAGDLAYASSAMVFTFLEQRFGFETARDAGVGLTQVDGWVDTSDADALLGRLTGMTLEGLEQEWAAWALASYG